MCFEKRMLNAWYERHAFYDPMEHLIFTYICLCINNYFSQNVCLTGKHMFLNTRVIVLRGVRKTYVNEHALNVRYSIYTLIMW